MSISSPRLVKGGQEGGFSWIIVIALELEGQIEIYERGEGLCYI